MKVYPEGRARRERKNQRINQKLAREVQSHVEGVELDAGSCESEVEDTYEENIDMVVL